MFGRYVKVYESPSNIILSLLVAIGRYFIFIYISSLLSTVCNLNFNGYDRHLIFILSLYLLILRMFEDVYVKCDMEEVSNNMSIKNIGKSSYMIKVDRLPEGLVYLDKENPLKRREFIVRCKDTHNIIFDICDTSRSGRLSDKDMTYIIKNSMKG